MKILLLPALFASFFLLFSCASEPESNSETLNDTFAIDNALEITEKVNSDEKITPEDIELFNRGVAQLGNVKDSLVGKTVREVIEWSEENKKIQQTELAIINAKKFEMNNAVSFNLKGFTPQKTEEGREQNVISYQFANNTTQTIDSIAGMLQFFNATNNTIIKQFPLFSNKPMEPARGFENSLAFIHNPEDTRDMFIRNNLNNKMIRVQWKPHYLKTNNGKEISLEGK
ncbi:MAG: hypothetical protein Kapaf2KO_04840 [Candidatus Kapaibacteriales bacterium]